MIFKLVVYILISTLQLNTSAYRISETSLNTYLIHGIGSSQKQLLELEDALKSKGVYVYSLGLTGDPETSIFTQMDKQCTLYNEEIIGTLQRQSFKSNNIINSNLPLINLIGISQGGLIARCLVERYNDLSYSVKNVITIASPHMGVYYTNSTEPDWIYNMEEITFSEYWKDPFTYDAYLKSKKFLAKINNEVDHTEYNLFQYNFMNINKLVLIWSNIDTVIQPQQSPIFNYWDIIKAEKEKTLVPAFVNNTKWYSNDNLGLRYLNEASAIIQYMYPCNHDEFKRSICFNNLSITVNNKTLLDTLIKYTI
jgi:hypothetical protein